MSGPSIGLVIEAATDHVEVLVVDEDVAPLAHEIEDVGHGHSRRLVAEGLVGRGLASAAGQAQALASAPAALGGQGRFIEQGDEV